MLGAIVSPTDPLAASAVARQVRLPRRIITILEGESLANDATGLVVYRIAVGAVVTGSFSVLGGVADFVLVAAGGIATGPGRRARLGAAAARSSTIRRSSSRSSCSPATPPICRPSASASRACSRPPPPGLLCGHYWSYSLGARSRLQAVAVWDTLDFLLNAVLFLLLGLQLPVVLAEASRHDPRAPDR